jgi:predicted transcriptional regulator
MKRNAVRAHRNFKLPTDLDEKLRREATETMRTQTAILEIALRSFFALKPAERRKV